MLTAMAALSAQLTGSLVLPGRLEYTDVRKLTVGRFDHTRERLPAAVVRCATVADVAVALRFARAHGLPVAVRGGAHSFAEHSSTTGLLVDVGRVDGVRLGATGPFRGLPDTDAATVGAGTRLGTLSTRLRPHGRTVPCGWCPTVSVAGAVLGGGYGALGRLYGLGCDHLLAAQVVLACGEVVMADERREPDLFWALRGAGGANFGVVTSLLLRTRPAVRTTTFHHRWPYRLAAEVLTAWQAWAPDAPRDVNAELALLASGDVADPPMVVLFGVVAGDRAAALARLDAFTALVGAPPDVAHVVERVGGEHSYLGFPATEGPTTGRPANRPPGLRVSRSAFVDRPLPPDAVRRLVAHLADGRARGQYRDLELIPWRGAYSDVATADTAFAHRGARFMLKHAVQLDGTATARERHAARAWLTGSEDTVAGHHNGGVYPNYPQSDLAGWVDAYHGPNLPRLRRVKAAYDPAGTFTSEQSVPYPAVTPVC